MFCGLQNFVWLSISTRGGNNDWIFIFGCLWGFIHIDREVTSSPIWTFDIGLNKQQHLRPDWQRHGVTRESSYLFQRPGGMESHPSVWPGTQTYVHVSIYRKKSSPLAIHFKNHLYLFLYRCIVFGPPVDDTLCWFVSDGPPPPLGWTTTCGLHSAVLELKYTHACDPSEYL